MNRSIAGRVHGGSIAAPAEGIASGESPRAPSVAGGRRDLMPSGGRWALVASSLRLLLGLLVVLGVSAAVAWSAHRYALTSPRFSVREVQVEGGKRVDSEAVRALSGMPPGANLFALDTARIEQRLLENPWIVRARVTRRLPSTLRVELEERESRAITLLSGLPYLVSADGEPIKRLSLEDSADLPLITGLDSEHLARDRRRELERLVIGLEVLRQYERLGMSRSYVPQEVHLAEGGSVSLTVGKDGMVLHLGKGAFRQRLLMAERVVLETRRAGKLPGMVFADNEAHPERVVVRMR